MATSDIDWSSPAETSLALGRIVHGWRSHLERAASSRERAASLRANPQPPPAGVSEHDWEAFPGLLDAQAAEWDAAAAADADEYRAAVAEAVSAGRLTRAQSAQLQGAATAGDADAAVAALKREVF